MTLDFQNYFPNFCYAPPFWWWASTPQRVKVLFLSWNKVLKPTACKYSIISMISLDSNAQIHRKKFKTTCRLYIIISVEGNLRFNPNYQWGVVIKYGTTKEHLQKQLSSCAKNRFVLIPSFKLINSYLRSWVYMALFDATRLSLSLGVQFCWLLTARL